MSSLPTYVETEEDQFFEQYRELSAMLALFWDPNGKTDLEIARGATHEYSESWIQAVVADGQRFLHQRELPMRLIATNANRYLVTEAEQRQWLQTLLDRVQAELASRRTAEGASR